MKRAYSELYLDDAMQNLGEAVEYAVKACDIEADRFMDYFITGGISGQFERGVPKYVSGKSGTELVIDVVEKAGDQIDFPDALIEYSYSPQYWSGWILAYYQWFTGKSFKDIMKYISMEDIIKLYPTLHEASEEKFVDTINKIISKKDNSTKLRTLRKTVGLSQKELSDKSGVSIRMIQQYEQRAKDINRATGENLMALARTLGCRMEDLMENNI